MVSKKKKLRNIPLSLFVSTVSVPEAPEDAISNSLPLKTVYTREVTAILVVSSSLPVTGVIFTGITSYTYAALPPCGLFMKCPSYF